jgi:hypothetical protein
LKISDWKERIDFFRENLFRKSIHCHSRSNYFISQQAVYYIGIIEISVASSPKLR